jgi:integrase
MSAGLRVYDSGKVVRTPQGPRPWRHESFNRLVWMPAVEAAAAAWRAEHGLDERADTPFEWWVDPETAPADGRRRNDDGRRWLTSHDLRATAVTLMRDLGIARDICAARVGHADAGQLVDAIYDKGDRVARIRKGLAAVAPDGLRAALGGAS